MTMRKRTHSNGDGDGDSDGGSSKKKKNQKNCSSDFTPEFFKVYLPHLTAYQLHIPRAFIHQYKATIQKKLILKEKGGRLWHVELSKTVDNYFITKGWEDFVKHHALCSGDFLVFRYDGNATFSVKIFGLNGCKKEILSSSNIKVKVEHVNDEVAKAQQTDVAEAQQTKVAEAQQTDCVHTPEVETNNIELSQKRPENDKSSDLEKVTHSRLLRSASKDSTKLSSGKATGLAEADVPYFIRSIYSSVMNSVLIPKRMITKYKIKLKPKMFLCHRERRWPVSVRKQKDGRLTFGKGWLPFWKDNSLNVGDKCMFKFGTSGAVDEVEVQVLSDADKTKSIKVET